VRRTRADDSHTGRGCASPVGGDRFPNDESN